MTKFSVVSATLRSNFTSNLRSYLKSISIEFLSHAITGIRMPSSNRKNEKKNLFDECPRFICLTQNSKEALYCNAKFKIQKSKFNIQNPKSQYSKAKNKNFKSNKKIRNLILKLIVRTPKKNSKLTVKNLKIKIRNLRALRRILILSSDS